MCVRIAVQDVGRVEGKGTYTIVDSAECCGKGERGVGHGHGKEHQHLSKSGCPRVSKLPPALGYRNDAFSTGLIIDVDLGAKVSAHGRNSDDVAVHVLDTVL